MVKDHDDRDVAAIRLAELHRWAAGHLGDTRHERRVTRVAAALFDLTRDLHGLGKRERLVLKAAALLHDVGRCGGADDHHVRGAEMVRRSRSLRLPPEDRTVIAFLARYHRGAVPERRRDSALSPAIGFRTARVLAGLLRAADALDSRRLASPTLAIRRSGRSLHVRCYVKGDVRAARRLFERRKKFRLLEEMLSIGSSIEVCRLERFSAVRAAGYSSGLTLTA